MTLENILSLGIFAFKLQLCMFILEGFFLSFIFFLGKVCAFRKFVAYDGQK